jgi:S1-C subfamily serine protease
VKQAPAEQSGSGVVIDGRRILTNAHVVRYASQVRVQADRSGEKLAARVTAIAVGIDLALLELDDVAFFDAHPAATFAPAPPALGTKVSAVGFPMGGEALSVTEGSISRIEFAPYGDGASGLRIQVDAAINPGNSGGPAAVADEVIGLCFSTIRGADNIGYVIPNEEIEAFLADVQDGRYDGRPQLFGAMQTIENPALRARLGIGGEVAGLMLTRPPDGPAREVLRAWDVLTRVGDLDIDNTGMVSGPDGLRLSFHYWVPKLARDGKVAMTILRDGALMPVDVPVTASSDRLIRPLGEHYPSYFIWGPAVFTPVYAEYAMAVVNRVLGDTSPILSRLTDERAFPGEELVMIACPLFSHPLSNGYDAGPFSVVGRVNGIAIQNLVHLAEVLTTAKDEYVVLEFADHGTETLVFRRAEVEAAAEEILEDNGIRSRASADLELSGR